MAEEPRGGTVQEFPHDHDVSRPDLRRPVVARGIDYPDHAVIAPHSHARAQLFYASRGAVLVETDQGAWMMPPQHGLWIPPGVEHRVRTLGRVQMRSLYFTPAAVPDMPRVRPALGLPPLVPPPPARAPTRPDRQRRGRCAGAAGDGIGAVGTPVFPSFCVMSSYILTGEHRRYRKAVGAFGRVIPEHSTGAWELALRYSYLDLDSGSVEGGTLHSATAGLNWYTSNHFLRC
mgnify:CR=1 FL=1